MRCIFSLLFLSLSIFEPPPLVGIIASPRRKHVNMNMNTALSRLFFSSKPYLALTALVDKVQLYWIVKL